MKSKKTVLPILILSLLSLAACEFAPFAAERRVISTAEDPTPSPTPRVVEGNQTVSPTSEIPPVEATSEPTSDPTSEPTLEPTQESAEIIQIGIDNVEQLTLQTQIDSGMNTIVSALDLSKDGRYLAIAQWGDPEVDIRLWDFQTASMLPPLDFHTANVTDVTFSPDGERLASSSQNGEVALWEVGSWELVADFSTYERGAYSLGFSPDGHLLAIGGQRNQLGVWRMANFERVNYYEWSGPHVVDKVAFTADGSLYYADTGYADVTAWNTADGELVQSFRGEACIGGFDLSSDESKLAYSSECSDAHSPHDPLARVAVRDVATGDALVYGDRKEDSTIVYYTADDSLIITNNRNRLRFWDAADGSLVHQIPTSAYYIEFMLSEDGGLLIVGGGKGDIRIYAVE